MKILTMIFRPSLLLITFAGCAFAQTVVLKADDNTGHDEVWEKRYTDGKNSWGIRGDRENATVYEGRIWFDKFPGVSGKYKVELGAVYEEDGAPSYKVSAGGRTLREGRYPYANGAANCKSSKHQQFSVKEKG